MYFCSFCLRVCLNLVTEVIFVFFGVIFHRQRRRIVVLFNDSADGKAPEKGEKDESYKF